MSKPIEPTEEQKQAANAFVARHGEQNEVIDSGGQARLEWSPTHTANDIACLLAELVGKGGDNTTFGRVESLLLRHQVLKDEDSALRAMVRHCVDLEARTAQHLADILVLRDAAKHGRRIVGAWVDYCAHDEDVDALAELDEAIGRTNHYDDAKADAPAAVGSREDQAWATAYERSLRARG